MFKLITKTEPKVVSTRKHPVMHVDFKGKIYFNIFAIDILDIKAGDYIMFFYDENEKRFGVGKSTITKKKMNGKVEMIIDNITNETVPKKFGSKLFPINQLDQFSFKPRELRCSNKYMADKLLGGVNNENFYYKIEDNPRETIIETAFENISVLVFPLSFYGSKKHKKRKEKTYKNFE